MENICRFPIIELARNYYRDVNLSPTHLPNARPRAVFFSHRLRNNDGKRRLFFEALSPHLWACTLQKQAKKKRGKKTTRPSKRGTSSVVTRSAAIERFLRVRTRTRIVDEYSPRAIISASPSGTETRLEIGRIHSTNKSWIWRFEETHWCYYWLSIRVINFRKRDCNANRTKL